MPETTHHILWECPRWELQRQEVPEPCRGAASDSISAKDCGICHLHYASRVKQLWPKYQLALAKIIQAYQEAASRERRAARGVGIVRGIAVDRVGHPPPRHQLSDNPEIAQATALEPFWHTSVTFPITAMLTREQNGARWPFSEQSLSQLLWFLQLLRRPPEDVEAPTVSVLELYFCFLLCNGGHRFLSGVSEEGHGQRLAIQVDKFTKGILAWQTMSRSPIFLEHGRKSNRDRITWQTKYGYPASPSLIVRVLLPHWGRVRRYMIQEAQRLDLGRREGTNSRLWRFWAPGVPGSQCILRGGALPVHSPLWAGGGVRVRGKRTVSLIEVERKRVEPYVRMLKHHPGGQMLIDDVPVWHSWRDARIVSRIQMQQHRRHLGLQVQRVAKLIQHTERVLQGQGSHVTSVYVHGERFTCDACHQSCPMHGAWAWLCKPCLRASPATSRLALSKLQHAADTLPELLRATGSVLHG